MIERPVLYFASPSEATAHVLKDYPVLLSYALQSKSAMSFFHAYQRILIDSGAFTEFKTGKKVDLSRYIDWVTPLLPNVDAAAGLDNIQGNWKQSLKNYERFGFPTMHLTDPPELLDDLLPIAKERWGWLGIGGVAAQRRDYTGWIQDTLSRVPDDIHVHVWGAYSYSHIRRVDSFDTAFYIRDYLIFNAQVPFLTPQEALAVTLKRIRRAILHVHRRHLNERGLFDHV